MSEKNAITNEQNTNPENPASVPGEMTIACFCVSGSVPRQEMPENEGASAEYVPVNDAAETELAAVPLSETEKDGAEKFFVSAEEIELPAAEELPVAEELPAAETPAAEEPPHDEVPAFPDMEQLRKMIREEMELQFLNSAEQIEAEFGKLRRVLSDSVDKDKMLEEKDELFRRVYAELKKHQTGFVRDINMPIIKTAIKWYERVSSMHRYYSENAPSANPCQAYLNLLKEFGNFGDYILDMLANHDIEAILPVQGDLFDPALHAALDAKKCSETELNNTVAECFTPGFRFSSDGKIIQFAQVSVFKFTQEI